MGRFLSSFGAGFTGLEQDFQDFQDLQDERDLGDANHLSTVARGPVPHAANCLEQDFQDFQDLQDERDLGDTNPLFTVARGPVPRDLPTYEKNVRNLRGHGRLLSRPMHGEGQALALRAMRRLPISGCRAGACPPRSPACPSDCSSGSPDPERVKIGRSCLQRRDKLSVLCEASGCLKQDSQDLQDLQDYLSRNEQSFSNGCLFRSFRTCMSIEKQICHRFQGPLGP